MKVLSISFWGGIITAVLFFITMLCFAWDDGRMHEKEIKNNIWKYILFLLMGMITSVFCLVFVFAYFTNRKYVFKSKNKISFKEGISFYISRIGTLFLDMLMMYVFVTVLGFNDKIIKFVVQIIVIILNYILSKFIVFKKK